MRCAGVDGCPGGWAVALRDASGPRLLLAPAFDAVLDLGADVVALDLPVGLPEAGARAADDLARARLGPRRASVFPAPPRRLLAVSRFRAGLGASAQAFALVPKIREVDARMTPALQRRVHEAHPELAFARLHGGPLPHAKRTPEGVALRRRLVARALPGALRALDRFLAATRRADVREDDALDALALLTTAERIRAGVAERLPARPPRDTRGLRMEIWV